MTYGTLKNTVYQYTAMISGEFWRMQWTADLLQLVESRVGTTALGFGGYWSVLQVLRSSKVALQR